jgi:hypothetical protein
MQLKPAQKRTKPLSAALFFKKQSLKRAALFMTKHLTTQYPEKLQENPINNQQQRQQNSNRPYHIPKEGWHQHLIISCY